VKFTAVVEITGREGISDPQGQTIERLENAIREAGREPMQRNTFYERTEPKMEQEGVTA